LLFHSPELRTTEDNITQALNHLYGGEHFAQQYWTESEKYYFMQKQFVIFIKLNMEAQNNNRGIS
jgi:hypothetical protein